MTTQERAKLCQERTITNQEQAKQRESYTWVPVWQWNAITETWDKFWKCGTSSGSVGQVLEVWAKDYQEQGLRKNGPSSAKSEENIMTTQEKGLWVKS